ncbi:sensor histidine kinase [Flavisolibacter nicotianae]|uniref:sensor histidine kinase n=1 Tax=Flavisolibacter nicotianae TaxID=2364882 RepID=UPI001F08EA9D|nr:PAS domain-containing sensor histidine kinase [Flavisolibacter nicotianae]
MPQLSSRQASVYAFLVFAITIALALYMPGYSITLSGLLMVIFLSVFVPGRGATLIAGVGSSVVVLLFLVWSNWIRKLPASGAEYFFLFILISFSTLIVLYIKGLLRSIQFDKSHMTSLFENATEGIILADQTASIVLVNPSACRMFGYDQDELVGQKVEVMLPTRYRAGHVQLRDGFYQHPQNREMGSGRDLFGQRKDGSNFPVEVSLSSYRQDNKQYVIAFVVDITHRKEIERSMLEQQKQLEKVTNDIRRMNVELEGKVEERTIILKEALQRLEQSQEELSEALDKERQLNEIKSRFVSMASHEFRTPLSSVLSSASLIGKYTTTEQQPNRDKHVNRIKESVKHLNDLLEDFLSLGKLDEGKIGAQVGVFHLSETIHDTIDEVRGMIRKGQEIKYTHDGDDCVNSDKKLLKNILINLLSNALKFSEENATVDVESRVDGEMATILVRDKGIGISPEDQDHLFSSFFRGKNALNIQGTGLGLHIVKRYTELIGGTINLQSALGHGTTVTITIPIKENEHDEDNSGH